MSTEDKILTTLIRDLRIMQDAEDERNGDAAPQTARQAADKIEALTARLYWAERDLIAAKAELQRMRKEVVLP